MKKRDKPPEVAAFEQAFDRPGQNGARSGQPWRTNSGRLVSGQTPGGNAFGSSESLWNQRQPSAPFPSRASGKVPTPSQPLRRAPSSGLWPTPGQPAGRSVNGGRVQDWGLDDEEEQPGQTRRSAPQKTVPPRAAGDRFSSVLVGMALAVLALLAAYSMQSHSQRHFNPGAVNGTSVSGISYDAGWPLTYARVDAQQPVPLSDVEPSPAFHYIQPISFVIDIALLSVPFWLLLEAAWTFWAVILERCGSRRPLRRFFAIGFTALPAALWLLAAFAAGTFVGFLGTSPSAWPKYVWLALPPAIPGFGLASGASVVLGIPANLWPQDFGVFLLLVVLPLAVLTACLYVFFCLVGRSLRNLAKGGQK